MKSLFFAIFLSLFTHKSYALMGNMEGMIESISNAVIQDKENSDEAKKLAQKSLNDVNLLKIRNKRNRCSLKDSKTFSFAKIEKKKKLPKKKFLGRSKIFFEAQFLAVKQNGTIKLSSFKMPILNIRDIVGDYAKKNGLSRQQVLNFDEEKLKTVFSEYIPEDFIGQAKEDTLSNAVTLSKMSQFNSAKEAFSFIEKRMKKASFVRKIGFLSNYLSYLNDNYDDDEAAGDESPQPQRANDLHLAVKNSFLTGKVIPAGICRHIHSVGVKLAEKMGFKDSFAVGFKTKNGGHRTLVLNDPKRPQEVIQLNYNSVTQKVKRAGVSSLNQDSKIPDTGIRFRIYNSKDKLAIVLPSELGGILNSVTGGKDSDLSLGFRNESQIQQVGVDTPYGVVRIFRSNNPLGNKAKVTGLGYNFSAKYNKNFYGDYGAAAFVSNRDTLVGELKQKGVYGRTKQGARTTFYESDKLSLKAYAEAGGRIALQCASYNDEKCKGGKDYDIDGRVGTMADYTLADIELRTSLLAHAQTQYKTTIDAKNTFRVLVPTFKLSQKLKKDLSPTTKLQGEGSLILYNLGTRKYLTYDGKIFVAFDKIGLNSAVGASGRVISSVPFWIPDSERSAAFSIDKSLLDKKVNVRVYGKQSLESFKNHFFGISVGGSLGR